ncbi:hypothetical protein DRJ17_04825 [Candidatus Woesearchaeota archaeon]|nr:MAG: hypothetical protein DRJ17_04825 [Candidatus Woesearchaeota archaeon]
MIPKEVVNNVSKIEPFMKGKRGLIYIGKYRKKKVAIKVPNPKSEARGNLRNEGEKIAFLNRYKIGPKLLFYGENFLVYEFVPGEFIIDFVKNASRFAIRSVLMNVLSQCYLMDRLKLNKEEMHRPVKHIIVGKRLKVTMIDFERCKQTKKPHNVTQFCQFLTSSNFAALLKEKGFEIYKDKMLNAARIYKHDMSRRNFRRILMMLR